MLIMATQAEREKLTELKREYQMKHKRCDYCKYHYYKNCDCCAISDKAIMFAGKAIFCCHYCLAEKI